MFWITCLVRETFLPTHLLNGRTKISLALGIVWELGKFSPPRTHQLPSHGSSVNSRLKGSMLGILGEQGQLAAFPQHYALLGVSFAAY
jgi:hypothetical protein